MYVMETKYWLELEVDRLKAHAKQQYNRIKTK